MIEKKELVEKLKKEEIFEDSKDNLDEGNINHFSNEIDNLDVGFLVSFDEVSDGEYYTMGHYYSNKLLKTIILDWNVNASTYDDLIDELYRLQKEAEEIEEKINIK